MHQAIGFRPIRDLKPVILRQIGISPDGIYLRRLSCLFASSVHAHHVISKVPLESTPGERVTAVSREVQLPGQRLSGCGQKTEDD